jgi:3-oxoacyl-[acyl-carrier-protein] synthase III
MSEIETTQDQSAGSTSFFEEPRVRVEEIPVGPGVPLGIERVSNPRVGIAGVYGTWGASYDNAHLPALVEDRLGFALGAENTLNLSELGFLSRHHVPRMTDEEHVNLEVSVGARLLAEAADVNGWDPSEVEAVLVGVSIPASSDFVERIAAEAGIPDSALKVTVHKACDGSVGALNLALNPELAVNNHLTRNLAERLYGKKILVGGIEGLSRVLRLAHDAQAAQLFGNGAGIFGLIPGQTMKFLVGTTREAYDEEGALQVHMAYPHSRQRIEGQSLIEVAQTGENSIRVAGLMHEPEDPTAPVVMAGPMGMVKLFVRNGVEAVRTAYQSYRAQMIQLGLPDKEIAVAIVHHANYKINQLKEKQLRKEGICIPMPWLLSEFGNVSAASNMIAFLRELTSLKPGDHVLFDGVGAGSYYDVLAVELGG